MFRGSVRVFRQSSRLLSTRTFLSKSNNKKVFGSVLVGVGLGVSYYAHRHMKEASGINSVVVAAASKSGAQPTVFSETKNHALYLTIHLTPKADKRACAKVVANIQKMVDRICPADMRDEEDEMWAGVGFSYNFYQALASSGGGILSFGGAPITKKDVDFRYVDREGPLGKMPATGGDIFIHAKSHQVSKLFELSQEIHKSLPSYSVDKFEDVYSFVYRNGRDLSGFIDGTENPASGDDRESVAVEPSTQGSYVITQKWLHDHGVIRGARDSEKEGWVGRSVQDSSELRQKAVTSHVARMTGGTNFEQAKKFQLVRQSMPFGTVGGDNGLFFIAYAASPDNFNYMLDRMVGKGEDPHSDNIMRLSRCVQGNFWYFPSVTELSKLA